MTERGNENSTAIVDAIPATGPRVKPQVNTVLRIHDVSGIKLLERAVQTLHAQQGVRVQPIIVSQRFDAASLVRLRSAVERQWFLYEEPSPVYINLDRGAGDSRSILMNLGIDYHLRTGGKYLAFLDYDDLLYTHAYRLLLDRLEQSNAAVAFATVEVADAIPFHDYEFIYATSQPYCGKDKFDLIRDNFCPLHSYLIDTSALDPTSLFFRPEMVRVEDYDFLLRVAGSSPCDFKSIGKKIGLYIRRSDGSNSTPGGLGSVLDLESGTEWKDSHGSLDRLRANYEVRFFASDF